MTTSLYRDVHAALEARAIAVTGFPPAAQRARDGKTFAPTIGTPWVRMHRVPVLGRPYSIDAGTIQHRGLWQVDLFYPASTGIDVGEDVAGAIKDAFRPGLRLTVGSDDELHVMYTDRGPDDIKREIERTNDAPNEWTNLKITVAWRCFSSRN